MGGRIGRDWGFDLLVVDFWGKGDWLFLDLKEEWGFGGMKCMKVP